jgi:hypothetical protein
VSTTTDDEKIEWDTRRLHKFSLEDIQTAIGKALQELRERRTLWKYEAWTATPRTNTALSYMT